MQENLKEITEKLFYFSHRKKKAKIKAPNANSLTVRVTSSSVSALMENIRKRFHFEGPKRLFQTIPRKNIAEVPRIRGVLHLLIFTVSY